MRSLMLVLALSGSVWAQSAIELKTNDGGGSPQVRLSITSGASPVITASVELAMGSQKITGLANGTASGDAVNFSQLGSINGPFVQLASGSVQAWTSANVGIYINENGGSTPNLMQLQVASADVFAINNSGAVFKEDSSTNTVLDVLTLDRTTSGTAANSIGTGLLFRAEDAAGTTENVAQIRATLTDATDASEDSTLAFYTRGPNGTALTSRMTIASDGGTTITAVNSGASGALLSVSNGAQESSMTTALSISQSQSSSANAGNQFGTYTLFNSGADASTNITGTIYGTQNEFRLIQSSDASIAAVTGFETYVNTSSVASLAGPITTVTGYNVKWQIQHGDTDITDFYGYKMASPTTIAAGVVITNCYGLYLADITAGSGTITNRYPIYQAGENGYNYFAAPMVFDEMAAPSASSAEQVKLYFDSTADRLMISEDAGGYVNITGGRDVTLYNYYLGRTMTNAASAAPGSEVTGCRTKVDFSSFRSTEARIVVQVDPNGAATMTYIIYNVTNSANIATVTSAADGLVTLAGSWTAHTLTADKEITFYVQGDGTVDPTVYAAHLELR